MAQPQESTGGPTVTRILLGTQLRRLRELAGVTPQEAGSHIRASHAKISRIELGRVGFKDRDIADLLTLYGVQDERERAGYLALVAGSNARGWWNQDNDLIPGWFEMYLRLEQEASVIRTYQVQFVPGLVQCEEYARAVIRTRFAAESAYEIDRRVQLRRARQKMLTEPGAPHLWAIVDESALSRSFGAEVMRAQLAYLIEVAALPNVSVQMLPFRAGGHAAGGGPFSILRFAVPELPDVVYLEQLNSSIYLDKRTDVEEYLWVMERLSVQAETPVRTTARLRKMLEGLG